MNMIEYYTELIENKINGYYLEDRHGKEFCRSINNYIKVNEELHCYLLTLREAKFIGEKEDRLYTIDDKELFSIVEPSQITIEPSFEERLAALESAMMGVL